MRSLFLPLRDTPKVLSPELIDKWLMQFCLTGRRLGGTTQGVGGDRWPRSPTVPAPAIAEESIRPARVT